MSADNKKPARTRAERWELAVAGVARALEAARPVVKALEDALDDLRAVRDEYEEWRDALPDNQQSSHTAELLNAIVDLDVPSVEDALEEVNDLVANAEDLDLPLGYGRD